MRNIIYFYWEILQPHFQHLRSTPDLIRLLGLTTEAFQLDIFNFLYKYFLFYWLL